MTKEGACVFYSVMVAYNFDVKIRHCRFCKDYDSLEVFEILIWESYKCILFYNLRKRKRNLLIDYL